MGIGVLTILLYSFNTLLNIKLTQIFIWSTLLILLIVFFSLSYLLKRASYFAVIKKIRLTNPNHAKLSGLSTAMIFFISLIIGFMFLNSFFVPIYKHDAYLYHFPIAQETFLTGYFPSDISPSISEVERAYPPLGYFSYSIFYFAQGKENIIIPKMLPFIYGLLVLVVLYHLSRIILGRTIEQSLGVIIIALASYYFSNIMIFENTDIYMGFYLIAAVSLTVQFFKTYSPSLLYLAAIMSAFSYWTKYIAIIGIISLILVLIVTLLYLPQHYRKKVINYYIIAGIIGVIIILPHALRTFILTGNPVYPLLFNFIGGKFIDDWVAENVLYWASGSLFSRSSLDFVFRNGVFLFPLLISWIIFFRKSFSEKIIAGFSITFFVLWATFLRGDEILQPVTYRYLFGSYMIATVIVGPVFIAYIKNQGKKYFINFLSFGFILFAAFNIVTYFIPTLYHKIGFLRFPEFIIVSIILILLGAFGFLEIKKFNIARYLIISIFLLPVFFSLLIYPIQFYQTGELGKDIAYSLHEPSHSWMVENLSPEDTILFFDERLYLFPTKYFPADTPELKIIYETEDLNEALKFISEKGITHLFITEFAKKHPLYSKSTIFRNIDSKFVKEIYSEDESKLKVKIYEINVNGIQS